MCVSSGSPGGIRSHFVPHRGRRSGLVFRALLPVWDIRPRDGAELGAKEVGRKAGAKKTAIGRGDFALIRWAFEAGELAPEALADKGGLVCIRENRLQRGLDMLVGNSARAQFTSDAKTPLAARLGVVPRIVERKPRVVQVILLAQSRDHRRDQLLVLRVAREILLHLMNRVRAPHQRPQRGCVQILLGGSAGRRRSKAHRRSIEASSHGSKETTLPCASGITSRGQVARGQTSVGSRLTLRALLQQTTRISRPFAPLLYTVHRSAARRRNPTRSSLITALVLAFALVPASAPGQSASKSARPSATQKEFQALINRYYADWNTGDPEKAAPLYAKDPDLVFYDLTPLEYVGWTADEKGVRAVFASFASAEFTPHNDLRATRHGTIAWTTETWHLSGKKKNGQAVEMEGRHTTIWEQRGGHWLIVHEHFSTPLQ